MSFEKDATQAALTERNTFLSGAQWARQYLTKPTVETEKTAEEYAESNTFCDSRFTAKEAFLAGAQFERGRVSAEIQQLQAQCAELVKTLEWYARPSCWKQGDGMNYDVVDNSDCADYPHITRDVRLTGGYRARETLSKLKSGKGEL